jgi:hypothetical protein
MKRLVNALVVIGMTLVADSSRPLTAEPGWISTCAGIGCPGTYWGCKSYIINGVVYDCYENALALRSAGM